MLRALRNVLMLLTLLSVIICNMGLVSVCECHGDIFTGTCSCHASHRTQPSCSCHGHHDTAQETQEHPALVSEHHQCKHLPLKTDELIVPVFQTATPIAPVSWVELPDFFKQALNEAGIKCPIPPAPDIRAVANESHEGYCRPLLI